MAFKQRQSLAKKNGPKDERHFFSHLFSRNLLVTSGKKMKVCEKNQLPVEQAEFVNTISKANTNEYFPALHFSSVSGENLCRTLKGMLDSSAGVAFTPPDIEILGMQDAANQRDKKFFAFRSDTIFSDLTFD